MHKLLEELTQDPEEIEALRTLNEDIEDALDGLSERIPITDIAPNPLKDKEIREYIDSFKHNRTLTYVDFSIRCSDVLFKEFCLSLKEITSLRYLSILKIFTDTGVANLSNVIKLLPQLTYLSLAHCEISETGATMLGAALKGSTTLTALAIHCSHRIGSAGGKVLTAGLGAITTLTTLDIDENGIDDQGAKDIVFNFLRSSNLKSLAMKSRIRDEGARHISLWLHQNTTLTSLTLGPNRITDTGVKALCLSLKNNKTLRHLNLEGNRISNEGVSAILDILNNNINLCVNLSGALMSREQKKRYEDLEARNRSSQECLLLALKNGKPKEVELFLQRGILLPPTALHVAVQENHSDLAEYLIEQGENVNQKVSLDERQINHTDIHIESRGKTAVDLAASLDRIEIVKLMQQPRIVKQSYNFTPESYRKILDECNLFKASLVMLVLRNCNLKERYIALLAENLQEFSKLRVLNLDDNQIGIYGFNLLVKKLPRGLNRLSLKNNLIDYQQSPSTTAEFRSITTTLPDDVEINFSSNLIESTGRNKGIKKVLILLLTKYNATVEEILTSQFKEIRTKNPDEHTLTLKFYEDREQTIPLNYQQMHNIIETKNILRIPSEHAFFVYLLSMQQSKRLMKEALLKQTLFNAKENDKTVQDTAKELMDYHPEAPLKSYIRTHAFFRSNPIPRANSVLIPRIEVTVDTWVVSILAKKSKPGDILNQHAWLAYEGLTKHGQRFFKVANLTAPMNGYWDQFKNLVIGGAKPAISFFLWDGCANKTVEYLRDNTIMACFTADRSNVKRMHMQVLEDSTNLPLKYKMVLSSSATKDEKNKEMVNCTKWSLDKIEVFLQIKIPDDLKGKYVPYDVVNGLINSGISINTFDSSNFSFF